MDRTGFLGGAGGRRFGSPWLIVLAALSVISPAGCGWISLMMYNMNPNDTPAAFKDLHDKRVVVVCRPVVDLQFADSSVPRELTRQVAALLAQKVRKIDIVDDREASQWMDEHSWQKYSEIGKAMKADMVVGVDLERFTLEQGPTLLQGNAAFQIGVYDMSDGGKKVFEKSMPRLLYPPHTPISSSEKSEPEFRRQFIGVMAEQIGRQFYPHDSIDDFANDAGFSRGQ